MKKLRFRFYRNMITRELQREEARKKAREEFLELGCDEEPEAWKDRPIIGQAAAVILIGVMIQYHSEILHVFSSSVEVFANVIR